MHLENEGGLLFVVVDLITFLCVHVAPRTRGVYRRVRPKCTHSLTFFEGTEENTRRVCCRIVRVVVFG